VHDLIIRNATVVDGTGADRHIADVAIDGGVFVEIGADLGPGKREIDAEGHLIMPGWVDIHSHFDGQATWDPYMTPSSWHGVTTSIFGNCGVGFAPVRPGSEPYLINLMEGVEDIPGTVLAEGIDFRWETFPEYLDVLAETSRVMDIGAQMPHGALRFYVMGERGADHSQMPNEREIGEMSRLLEEALAAGAFGFTTSRTIKHRAADGSPTPSLSAHESELLGLADALRRAGTGVFEVNSDLGNDDFALLRRCAERAERPLSMLLLQSDTDPDLWRRTLAGIQAANRDGIAMSGQVGCRPIGVLMGLDTTINPFSSHPAWEDLKDLAPETRLGRLRDDAALRGRLVEERPDDGHTKWMESALAKTFELSDPIDYEPAPSRSMKARAKAAGIDVWRYTLDLMCRGDGDTLLLFPFENYSGGDLEVVREMLLAENTVCGLGDAGAHVATICDASYPTYLISHWARDRTRGEGLPLEFLVRKQTLETARTYGLDDRGVIAPGYKADFNIVDFGALGLTMPKVAHDLPAGGRRLVQYSRGYRHTFVSGTEVACDGEATGAMPGKLLRGAQTLGNGHTN
jgi:N-acyl-D-aspartate/D-glutamate deacylase